MGVGAREIALDVLISCEQDKQPYDRLIKSVLAKYDYMEANDKALIKRLCDGVIERRIELVFYINHFSRTPAGKMKPVIRNLVLMGVYQILYMDRIPDHAAVNEAVKLSKKRGLSSLSGFVNGVLRNISRNKESLPLPDRKEDVTRYLSVRYSLPEWIIDMWVGTYGTEVTEEIAKAFLEDTGVSVRFSERIMTEEIAKLIEEYESQGIKCRKSCINNKCFYLLGTEGIEKLPGFSEGKLTVQDASSAMAVKSAGIKKGDTVIDVCAAPGGKSIYAAELTGETGQVISFDVSEKKLPLIEENIERMGLKNIKAMCRDARTPDEAYIGKADVVLADVPCSGLGVIGKKKDIKYNMTPEGIESLTELQKEIIKSAFLYLCKGGTLLYSTCTIDRAENEEMAEWIEKNLPLEKTDSLQLLPGVNDCDGFFMARFVKK